MARLWALLFRARLDIYTGTVHQQSTSLICSSILRHCVQEAAALSRSGYWRRGGSVCRRCHFSNWLLCWLLWWPLGGYLGWVLKWLLCWLLGWPFGGYLRWRTRWWFGYLVRLHSTVGNLWHCVVCNVYYWVSRSNPHKLQYSSSLNW